MRFFRKKGQKNGPKPRSEESLKKPPSGDLFWDPKSIKIDVGAAGNRQNRAKNRKNGMQKFMRFFACEKNAKQREKKRDSAPPGGMRGARGGKEGCKTPAQVCMRSANMRRNFAMEVLRWSLCKSCGIHPARQQGCGGFKRFAHSAVPIWMIG